MIRYQVESKTFADALKLFSRFRLILETENRHLKTLDPFASRDTKPHNDLLKDFHQSVIISALQVSLLIYPFVSFINTTLLKLLPM